MKKGGQIYLSASTLAIMVFTALCAVSIIFAVQNYAANTSIEREYLAKDMAMMIDTLYSAPGDVEYDYLIPRPEFNFIIGKNYVIVKDHVTGKSSSYPYASSDDVTLVPFETKSPAKTLVMFKNGNQISFAAVNDYKDRLTLEVFENLAQFSKISRRRFDRECQEVFPIEFANNYFALLSRQTATLYYQSASGDAAIRTIEVGSALNLESKNHRDLILSSSSYEPSVGMSNVVRGNLYLVYKFNTWYWSRQTPEVDSLPKCSAEAKEV